MAVGDVISDVTAVLTSTFQPAAGVEVMITFAIGGNIGQTGLTDGVNTSFTYAQFNTGTFPSSAVLKLGITNTNYLWQTNNFNTVMYSGIQMK